jgi:hypothetical protein
VSRRGRRSRGEATARRARGGRCADTGRRASGEVERGSGGRRGVRARACAYGAAWRGPERRHGRRPAWRGARPRVARACASRRGQAEQARGRPALGRAAGKREKREKEGGGRKKKGGKREEGRRKKGKKRKEMGERKKRKEKEREREEGGACRRRSRRRPRPVGHARALFALREEKGVASALNAESGHARSSDRRAVRDRGQARVSTASGFKPKHPSTRFNLANFQGVTCSC